MRKLNAVLISSLFILSLFTACSADNSIEVVSFEYPKEIKTSSYREIPFIIAVKNTGKEPCTVKNIYSYDFWKPVNPGLDGFLNQEFNIILNPDQEQIFTMLGYIWDADTITDTKKEFQMVINLGDNPSCKPGTITIDGTSNFYK